MKGMDGWMDEQKGWEWIHRRDGENGRMERMNG